MPPPADSQPDCPVPAVGDGSTHPAIQRYAQQVDDILASHRRGEISTDEVAPAVARALEPVVRSEGLLTDDQREGCSESYTRHLLYLDPRERFTLLSLVWRPGQSSPIHGHTSWCAVGVHQGTPTEVQYDVVADASGARTATPQEEFVYAPGDTCFSREGWEDTHRVHNASNEDVVTLHIYGAALADNPAAINLLLD